MQKKAGNVSVTGESSGLSNLSPLIVRLLWESDDAVLGVRKLHWLCSHSSMHFNSPLVSLTSGSGMQAELEEKNNDVLKLCVEKEMKCFLLYCFA